MTVGDHIRKQVTRFCWMQVLVVAGLAAFAVPYFIMGRPFDPLYFLVPYVGVAILLMALLSSLLYCPKCRHKFGQAFNAWALMYSKEPRFCPFCGVSFDAALDQSERGQPPPGN